MKYSVFSRNIAILVVSAAGIAILGGCAFLADTPEGQAIVESASNGLGKLMTGDVSGALGQGIDIALILLGIKGAQKGGQKVGTIIRNRVLNPKNNVVPPATGAPTT